MILLPFYTVQIMFSFYELANNSPYTSLHFISCKRSLSHRSSSQGSPGQSVPINLGVQCAIFFLCLIFLAISFSNEWNFFFFFCQSRPLTDVNLRISGKRWWFVACCQPGVFSARSGLLSKDKYIHNEDTRLRFTAQKKKTKPKSTRPVRLL